MMTRNLLTYSQQYFSAGSRLSASQRQRTALSALQKTERVPTFLLPPQTKFQGQTFLFLRRFAKVAGTTPLRHLLLIT